MARPRLAPVNEACNLNVYLRREEMDKLRQMAFKEKISMGAMVRRLIVDASRVGRVEVQMKKIRDTVAAQAEDEGLWFVSQTCPESYLQQELRKLHAVVEEDVI